MDGVRDRRCVRLSLELGLASSLERLLEEAAVGTPPEHEEDRRNGSEQTIPTGM